MKANITSVAILWVMVICTGCDSTNKQLEKYKGDGVLRYSNGPLLGTSGFVIKMGPRNLQYSWSEKYNLLGIPPGRYYTVYLVVPDPCPDLDNVLAGFCSLSVMKNGVLVTNISSVIKDMTDSHGGGYHRFYFDDRGRIFANDSTSTWTLAFSYINEKCQNPLYGYIEVAQTVGK